MWCSSLIHESLKSTPLHNTSPIPERESEVVLFPLVHIKAGSSPDFLSLDALCVELQGAPLEFVGVVHRFLGAIEHARILL